MTLLHALERHTSSQRQWKGDLPRVQITGYTSVCFSLWLFIDSMCLMTNTYRAYGIQIHARICLRPQAWTGAAVEQAQVQPHKCVFMSGIVLVCHSRGVCLWHPGSYRLVLMVYVCLQFQENVPAHVPHFWGVWFHMPVVTLTLSHHHFGESIFFFQILTNFSLQISQGYCSKH